MVDVIAERPESSVRVTLAPLRKVAPPSDDEFERLVGLVLARWPILRPSSGEDWHGFVVQFRASFAYLLHTGRREKLDTDRSLSWWASDAVQWLRQHQPGSIVSIGGAAFVAAALAQGDVAHTMSENFPFDFSLALQFGGGGVPSTDAWRDVLRTERLLEPSPSPYPAASASPARVQQLALNYRRV